MHQINIFTNSLFFTDQKDSEFKKETIKTKSVDKTKFANMLKNFVAGLVKNYNINSQDVFIDNIKYYEDLNKEKTEKIIDQILKGQTPKPGSYRGRKNSEPENNRKTLLNIKNA